MYFFEKTILGNKRIWIMWFSKTNYFLFRTSGVFSYEHPEYFLTNISHSLLRTSVVFIPNIQHSIFRTSVIFYSEHLLFYVSNILYFLLRTPRRLLFRTSGFLHSDLPDFSFRTSGLFQSNRSSDWFTITDVRKKKQGRKGIVPIWSCL